jgi:hypothetical protein
MRSNEVKLRKVPKAIFLARPALKNLKLTLFPADKLILPVVINPFTL